MDKDKILNVLIFPGGTENGMEICKALRYCKNINLYSVSSDVVNHAPYIFYNHSVISDVHSEEWVAQLNQIIKKNNIHYIFPSNAYVIDGIIKYRSAINTKIILPESDIVKLTRSKKHTNSYFKDIIPVPKIYDNIEEIDKFPVFVKPDCSYGAQRAYKVNDELLLSEVMKRDSSLIMTEYLGGDEYSIDCFSDKDAQLLFCRGRTRERVRMGTSMHCEDVSGELNQFFQNVAQKILSRLKIIGAWFFQMKKDSNGNLKLLEIETRIAGTMAFDRVKGINFPLLSIYEFEGVHTKLLLNDFKLKIDRALINRYNYDLDYRIVYIDLDDTIIFNGKINLEIIKFLYQCVNKKIKLVLLSKSLESEKEEYLKKFKLYELFNDIIWLKEDESKSNYIIEKNSIFIDDSFTQRLEVAEKLNIPTFDPSMIEVLIDDRL